MSIHSHRTVYVSLSSRLTLLPRSPQPDSYMVPITDINVSDDGNAGEEWGLVLGDVTFDTATLAPLPGDIFATAGRTCSHLMAAGRPDGDYYIDPVGKGDFAQMAKVTCDMVRGCGAATKKNPEEPAVTQRGITGAARCPLLPLRLSKPPLLLMLPSSPPQ